MSLTRIPRARTHGAVAKSSRSDFARFIALVSGACGGGARTTSHKRNTNAPPIHDTLQGQSQ